MRPRPTFLYHFTHVDHLADIARHGALADSVIDGTGLLTVEVGHLDIKLRRRSRPALVGPGGVVADYVPFYFAPRSPMMYVIDRGGVPNYDGGCDELVYLTTTVERLLELGLRPIFTDRNAAVAYARFTDDVTHLEALVDWALMEAMWWYDTPAEPDRKERRMAECLVHRRVPWEAFQEVSAQNQQCARKAWGILSTAGVTTAVSVRPAWYF